MWCSWGPHDYHQIHQSWCQKRELSFSAWWRCCLLSSIRPMQIFRDWSIAWRLDAFDDTAQGECWLGNVVLAWAFAGDWSCAMLAVVVAISFSWEGHWPSRKIACGFLRSNTCCAQSVTECLTELLASWRKGKRLLLGLTWSYVD